MFYILAQVLILVLKTITSETLLVSPQKCLPYGIHMLNRNTTSASLARLRLQADKTPSTTPSIQPFHSGYENGWA